MATALTNEQQDRLVRFAMKHLGKPYVYGANQAPKNFDCSSFVQYVYRMVGIRLPRTTIDQIEVGRPLRRRSELLPGDLVFFRGSVGRYNKKYPHGVGHVAMYIGGGEIVHAAGSSRGNKVVREQLRTAARDYTLVAMRRISNEAGITLQHWTDR